VDCSVVIATHNRARLLADTLHSLEAQQVPGGLRWEVIVVDNNSRDETREVVRDFGKASSLTVQYAFEPRLGQSFARNLGIEMADGAVILFTDDDIIPNPDWVPRMLSTITTGDLDGVGGRVLPRWEAEVPRWLSTRPDLRTWLALAEEDQACMLTYPLLVTRRIVGASMAFRRDVFEKFGRFPTTLGHRGARLYGGEEVEFVNRLLLNKKRIGYDPSIVVNHRIRADRLCKSFFLRRLFDHACGQAQFLTPEGGATILGVELWRYRQLLESVGRTAVHTALRRPDAFSRQLDLVHAAGSIWGTLRWRSRRHLGARE
jgi:glucosyl-dolichyl phosphate glucuronosyltransferase